MLLDTGTAMEAYAPVSAYGWQAGHTSPAPASPGQRLRAHLTQHYDELLQSLTRRLGCRERAHDALHDTWLSLDEGRAIGHVASPNAYILRMAANRAIDQIRAETRHSAIQWEAEAYADELPDPAPGPQQQAEGRALLYPLIRAIANLPRQRREIFLAVRVNELSRVEAAQFFGITVRAVSREVSRAHDQCQQELLRACAGPP